MENKTCKACKTTLPTTDFYAVKNRFSPYCKTCAKKKGKEYRAECSKDPIWIEKERERARMQYWGGGRKKQVKTPEQNQKNYQKFKELYPEKVAAQWATKTMRNHKKNTDVLHHWSYRQEHWLDVIPVKNTQDHLKAHRFIVYDQERMMYRRYDTNELLDSKEKHQEFIFNCIKNKN